MSSTPRSHEAYVDSSAFVAFLDRSDSFHPLFRLLFSTPPRLTTTPLVIAETQAWFLRRYDTARSLQFLAMIEELTPLTVLSIGDAEIHGGTRILRRYSDQDLTMTDAVGLHVMKDRRIKICWSTDRHLALGGARLVIRT